MMSQPASVLPYKVTTNGDRVVSHRGPLALKVSLVVGFYNSIPLFDLLMASIERQSFQDFEVIICDDGSRPEVVQHIQAYMKTAPFAMQHIWHEDLGWRKVELLNKAVLMSQSDYIITIDQDCVLHPEFIHEHYKNRAEGYSLSGRRMELTPFLTKWVTPERVRKGFLEKNHWWMFFFFLFQKNNQWVKAIYIKSPFLRKWRSRRVRPLVGCNMSLFKKDLWTVNGYDMRFHIPCGAEDSDIDRRLANAGVKIKSVCNMAIQYHMHHKRGKDYTFPEEFKKGWRDRLVQTPFGLAQVSGVPAQQI